MKKWLSIVCLCMVATSQAGAWGLLPEASYADTWFIRQFGQEQVTSPVCVRTYVQGETLPGLPADSKVSPQQLVAEMENALNYWLTKPREFLQQSGRQEEFADFLAVLPKHITLQLQDTCNTPNVLQLVYAPREWYVNAHFEDGHLVAVTHKRNYTVPRIRTSDEVAWTENAINGKTATVTLYKRLDLVNLPQVLAHEAGHLIGLTNQYGFASYIIPGENTHNYFSYLYPAGPNTRLLQQQLLKRQPAALMGDPRYHAQALRTMWPDDVDGLINAVDMAQIYHHNLLSPRVVNGWKSFSLADKNIGYALAMPFQYTAPNTQPQELLDRAAEYAGAKIAGLDKNDFALLKQWYQQNSPAHAYSQVPAQDLHNFQLAQQTQQEVTRLHNTLSLEQLKGISFTAPVPVYQATLPDVINLRIPDENGQARTLPVVQNTQEDDPDCNFYLIITDKEMTWFEHEYGTVLKRAQRKQAAGKELTRKETRITRWYKQMLENKRKTEKCWVEPAH